jgi:hypothetical protein
MLQLLAFQNPSITVSNIQKVAALLNSYQNRQTIGLTILWTLGQGGMKDIRIGLKGLYFNLELELRNCLGDDEKKKVFFVCGYKTSNSQEMTSLWAFGH